MANGQAYATSSPALLVSRIQGFISLAERKTIPLTAATLRNYEGKYAFGNSTAQITLKNDRLVLQLSGDADIPLFAESDSLFFVRTTGTEVQFEQSATGPAVAMIIRSPGGNPIRCPRI
jgi:Domain of unknown function (DUF3471)